MRLLLLAIRWFYDLLVLLIFVRAIGSWFIRNPYSSRWYAFVCNLTEPLLAPCRKLLYRFQRGMSIDFSPVLALILLSVIYRVLIRVIILIMY